jgi:hypothetical protein
MGPQALSLIAFAVYSTILSLNLWRNRSSKIRILWILVIGLFFGLISYALVLTFNTVELHFMNTQGILHILVLGPIQEEISKFAAFFIAFMMVERFHHSQVQGLGESLSVRESVELGAFVGLFLALYENLIDYGNQQLIFVFTRTVTSWPIHMFTIGISSFGLFKYRKSNRTKILLYLVPAVAIHISFNLSVNLLGF